MKFWRVNLIFLLVILLGATVIGRLIYIQVLKGDFYKAFAQGQQKFFAEVEGERGEIFLKDKNGGLYPLAINKDWQMVYICPPEIENKEEAAQKLAQILGLEENEIKQKIDREESLFEIIKTKLSEEEMVQLKDLEIAGVYSKKFFGRYYPQNELASKVVGFLGGEDLGQYGIEGYYDSFLRGEAEFQEGGRNAWVDLFLYNREEPDQGLDIVLTIDYHIQSMAEELLKETAETLNIESGQIIVMDPLSGEIIALANFPGFNPNYYFSEEEKSFQNEAVYHLFEPGSVFKPITMAAALDLDRVSPYTTYIDEGSLEIYDDTIYNYDRRVWGERTMTEVLERSINTGAVFAENQVGHKDFLNYVEKFGFFSPTDIDLQEEAFSQNRELKKGYEINYATASFGQGIEITPIQIVRAYAAIVNGGKLLTPYVVEGSRENQEKEEKNVISMETSAKLTSMLVSVVENGYAKGAQVPGYYIGGKTGTAQVSWASLGIDQKGYSDKTWQSFVGFGPAFNPKFLILVKLDNPQTKTAEYSAIPVFKKLAKYIIDYYEIPPDYE